MFYPLYMMMMICTNHLIGLGLGCDGINMALKLGDAECMLVVKLCPGSTEIALEPTFSPIQLHNHLLLLLQQFLESECEYKYGVWATLTIMYVPQRTMLQYKKRRKATRT